MRLGPQFGAVYIPQTEFAKLPAELNFTQDVLSRRETHPLTQQKARNSIKAVLRELFGFYVGTTGRKDGVILITNDDAPCGREPEKGDVFHNINQTYITNYLSAWGAKFEEGKFTDLKRKTE